MFRGVLEPPFPKHTVECKQALGVIWAQRSGAKRHPAETRLTAVGHSAALGTGQDRPMNPRHSLGFQDRTLLFSFRGQGVFFFLRIKECADWCDTCSCISHSFLNHQPWINRTFWMKRGGNKGCKEGTIILIRNPGFPAATCFHDKMHGKWHHDTIFLNMKRKELIPLNQNFQLG